MIADESTREAWFRAHVHQVVTEAFGEMEVGSSWARSTTSVTRATLRCPCAGWAPGRSRPAG